MINEIRLVEVWGVVTPDDNDVLDFGPDRAAAQEELDHYLDEGLDTAKLVHRFASDWMNA